MNAGEGLVGRKEDRSDRETRECVKEARQNALYTSMKSSKKNFNGNFLKRNKIQNFVVFCALSLYESGKCSSCLILAHSTFLSIKIKIVT